MGISLTWCSGCMVKVLVQFKPVRLGLKKSKLAK